MKPSKVCPLLWVSTAMAASSAMTATTTTTKCSLTTIAVPEPTTLTNTDGMRLVITNAPTSITLQVKPTGVSNPDGVQGGGMQDMSYIQACFPSNLSTCCYLGSDTVLDPCLWDAAGVAAFISSLPSNPENDNWVTTLGTQVVNAGQDLPCDLTRGCNWGIPGADGTNATVVQAVIALVAAQNWFSYQYVNNKLISTTMLTFISGSIPNLFNQLYEDKYKASNLDLVVDGLYMIGAIVSVLAVPLTAGGSAATAAAILSASMGVSGGIVAIVSDSMSPVEASLGSEQTTLNFFYALQLAWANQMSYVAGNFSSNPEYASDILDANQDLPSGWLQIPESVLATWDDFSGIESNFDQLLMAYTSSRIWNSMNIFLHWEPADCSSNSLTSLNYPSQLCVSSWTNPVNVMIPESYVFPVHFDSASGEGQSPYDARQYAASTHWPSVSGDADWTNVVVGSWNCQYFYQSLGGNFPSQTAAPQNWNMSIITIGSISPVDVPCLYNLPVCSSSDTGTVNLCQETQTCCISQGNGNHLALNDWFSDPWQVDNFGLDNVCSHQLNGSGYFNPGEYFLNDCT